MFSTVVRLWILAGVYKELRLDGSILRGGREGLFVSRVTMTARDKAHSWFFLPRRDKRTDTRRAII